LTVGDRPAERYRRWFDYEKDSHAKVLEALKAAPERAKKTKQFRKAVELAGHIVASRQIWLLRLGAGRRVASDFFPRGQTLPELVRSFNRMHAAWSAYLFAATEREIARFFEYRSSEGGCYRDRVEDALTDLFGHSLYHRGQIALLLRSAGAEPAMTDFVFWTRKPAVQKGRKRRPKQRRLA
jgi:uncharacterized damage-inducible protein DinB